VTARRRRHRRRRRSAANLVGVALLAVVVAIGAWAFYGDGSSPRSVLSPVGERSLRLEVEPRLYPPNDPWRRFLASDRRCPGGEATGRRPAAQQATMLCLLNWARHVQGLPALRESRALSQAARRKARDIFRCSDFAHDACGKRPNAVALAVGYRGGLWGENLYAGTGRLGAPRVATDGWLNSAGHRENLFRPEWTEQGIAVLRVPRFKGYEDVTIWVSQFGR
jgi:uncharacterized protein YkwD